MKTLKGVMFELNVDTTMAVEASAPPQEDLDAGAHPSLVVTVLAGLAMPFKNPGTNQPIVSPALSVNFPLNKKAAIELAERIKTEAERLPDARKLPADFQVAQSLEGVDRLAEAQRSIRK